MSGFDQLIESVHIKFTRRYMNSRFPVNISDKGVWLAEFNQGMDDKRVASEDGLVQWHSVPTVDAWSSFLHQVIQNVEV